MPCNQLPADCGCAQQAAPAASRPLSSEPPAACRRRAGTRCGRRSAHRGSRPQDAASAAALPAGVAEDGQTSTPNAAQQSGSVSVSAESVYLEALSWYWGINGHCVDDAEALSVFKRAAEMGHPAAQLQMGVFFKCGGLVKKDADVAEVWFGKVRKETTWFDQRAEDGDVLAMWQLSRLIAHGLSQRPAEDALMWCRKAAEQGYALAQFDLSQCYHDGEGVPKDMTQASDWCKMAGDQDMVEASYWMGHYYRDGRCGPDRWLTRADMASACLRFAGARGHCAAQRLLGLINAPKRGRTACKWLKNSRDNGSLHSGQILKNVLIAQQHVKQASHAIVLRATQLQQQQQQQSRAGAITSPPQIPLNPPAWNPLASHGGGGPAALYGALQHVGAAGPQTPVTTPASQPQASLSLS
eukprot:Rhum_TRINITY_DN12589_c1_g1::Rhum_TRINITY_DN12589_c1_g1_i1::g.52997::m.52997/K07126/K07126; uncharacterized protein